MHVTGVSPFPTVVLKGIFPMGVKSLGFVVKSKLTNLIINTSTMLITMQETKYVISLVVIINLLPNKMILDLSNLKACADDKINVTQEINTIFYRIESIVGKGENAGY